jgi:hypothetical protein
VTQPHPDSVLHAEATVVRAAIARGFMTQDQLREGLLLREELRSAGQQVSLLKVLGSRYLTQEHQTLLTNVYFSALSGAPPTAAASEADLQEPPPELYTSEDELAIPEFTLGRSNELMSRPPSEDPDVVQQLLAASAEVEPPSFDAPPPADGTHEPDAPDPESSGSGIWRWLKGKK